METQTEITKELEGDFYQTAIDEVRKEKTATISRLQRTLRVGYNRAARLIEAMEADGIITPMDNRGCRKVVPKDSQ